MATAAQVAANRRNAQHSTGPVTDAGKAKTSRNAIRHFLCSSLPLTEIETPEEAQEVIEALREEHQPVGACEEILVYKMAEHLWHGRRAARYLIDALEPGITGLINKTEPRDRDREVALMLRYQGAADRGYYRALNELRKVQKERRLSEIGSVSQPVKAASSKPAPEPPKTSDPATPPTPSTEKVAATAAPNAKSAG